MEFGSRRLNLTGMTERAASRALQLIEDGDRVLA
jgi:hypothetical protein